MRVGCFLSMEVICGPSVEEGLRPAVSAFLARQGLTLDPAVQYTVCILESGQVIATGSLDGAICKCIAVDPAWQGEGLAEKVLTELRREAFARGVRRLFLYTKPRNELLFRSLSFFPVAATAEALLMESERGGLQRYLQALPRHGGVVGAVVANCDPFTLGHQYLIERASAQCDWLYVFVLSEEKGAFSAQDRFNMVRLGCQSFPNVSVHPTEGYLISSATFPTYFLKEKAKGEKISCQLDLEIFTGRFVPALGIQKRFVGTEPLDPVTAAYNRALQTYLPPRGVQVEEIPRLVQRDGPVSASRVRACLAEGRWQEVKALLPETTYQYIKTLGYIPE